MNKYKKVTICSSLDGWSMQKPFRSSNSTSDHIKEGLTLHFSHGFYILLCVKRP